MTSAIHSQVADGILHLSLQRADKKHALTHAMYTALADALQQASTDSTVRVVLLSGSAGIFTAGNDMGEFLNDPPSSLDSPVFRFLHILSTLEKPVIVAVSGLAIGIGTTLLLHADLVYCDRSARFQMPFTRLGLCPEAASSLLLPLLVGYTRAAELLLTGQPFDAARADAMGLVCAVLDDEDSLLQHARQQAAAIAALPAAAIRLTKQLLKKSAQAQVDAVMRHEGALFLERLHSPEALEAMAAFREKRTPDFSRFPG